MAHRKRVLAMLGLTLAATAAGGWSAAMAGETERSTAAFCARWDPTVVDASPIPLDDLTQVDPSDIAAGAKNARELAKLTPNKKLEKPLKRIATFLDRVADADDASGRRTLILSRSFEKYADAVLKVLSYVEATCAPTGE